MNSIVSRKKQLSDSFIYVKYLEQQADELLQTAPENVYHQAEEAFLNVARLEKDFWQMAFNAVQ